MLFFADYNISNADKSLLEDSYKNMNEINLGNWKRLKKRLNIVFGLAAFIIIQQEKISIYKYQTFRKYFKN